MLEQVVGQVVAVHPAWVCGPPKFSHYLLDQQLIVSERERAGGVIIELEGVLVVSGGDIVHQQGGASQQAPPANGDMS